MSDWSYLSALLDKVQAHSTVVGKIWMSVLFLFRIFVLGAAADNVWGDEWSEFKCDSQEPGCQHACYNWMFPISYVHFWVLQITFVTTPTFIYLGHAIHIIHKEKRLLEKIQDNTNGIMKKPKYTDERGKVKIKGVLFGTYLTQLIAKIILEVAFAVGQFYIYGSPFMVPYFVCPLHPPCSPVGAHCYISRPTEKTIFIIFMFVVSGISVLLNIIEIFYLICSRNKDKQKRILAQQSMLSTPGYSSNTPWGPVSGQYGGSPMLPMTVHSGTGLHSEEIHSSISKEKDT